MATRRDDPETPADAIEMLKADHQKVRNLFRVYERATKPDTKRQVAERAFTELELHAQLEATLFYPAFEEATDDEGKQLVTQSVAEHETLTALIDELRELDLEDSEFAATFQALMEHVEEHVEAEETEMFPEAEAILAEHAEDLLENMQALKRQLLAS